MARDKRKDEAIAGKGTPTASDRKVLKRAEETDMEEVPDVAGFEGGEKIEPVDLSLHGDGVTHWQDEPLSERKARRAREGKVPSRDEQE